MRQAEVFPTTFHLCKDPEDLTGSNRISFENPLSFNVRCFEIMISELLQILSRKASSLSTVVQTVIPLLALLSVSCNTICTLLYISFFLLVVSIKKTPNTIRAATKRMLLYLANKNLHTAYESQYWLFMSIMAQQKVWHNLLMRVLVLRQTDLKKD